MSFTSSALFGALFATAALGCRRDDSVPIAAGSYDPTPQATTPTADTTRTESIYQPETVGVGTSAPYGAGAVGGAAIATQPTLAIENDSDMAVSRETPTPATRSEPDRQGRTPTRRTRTNPDSEHQAIGDGDTYDRNR